MWSIFRNKANIWFKCISGAQTLEGFKNPDNLELRISTLFNVQSIKMNSKTTQQLIEWLLSAYPRRTENVSQLPTKLSLSRSPSDAEGSLRDPIK